MRALRFDAGVLQLAEVPPNHPHNEALIRLSLAGICSTDLQITRGYADYTGTLGHEFVGIVVASPDSSQVGRRVVGEINAGCGRCDLCRTLDSRHCEQRTVLGIKGRDGSFADFLSLPPGNLHFVPDHISDQKAVFVEPLAAACEILEQIEIKENHHVAVIGDGKLGQLVARVLATTGCDLVLVGKHPEKLEIAARAGIKTALHDQVDHLKVNRLDIVVEASGAENGLNLAIDLTRPRGTVILKSTLHGNVAFATWRIVVNELTVVGSRCGRFVRALELLSTGKIDVESLVAAEYSLSEGVRAMAVAASPGTLKVFLRP